MSDRQAFVLRLDHRLETALKLKRVGVGWSKLKSLHESMTWDSLQSTLAKTYPLYKGKARALGNATGSLWRFISEMKKGDLVVVPSNRCFYVAEITGQLASDPKGGGHDDFVWYRAVKWVKDGRPIDRQFASNGLQRRMKARQTCVRATDILQEIEKALDRRKPIAFNDSVIESASDGVAKSLQSAINDYGLECVVAKLAGSTGAKAEVLPKRSDESGDADVLAIYDLKIGNQESTVEVLYQVKQHEGSTGPKGIKQLIDRMHDRSTVVRGCLVTTAEDITASAAELARDNDIIVLTRKELIAWVLMAGLSALQD